MHDLQVWLEQRRPISSEEWQWLNKMLYHGEHGIEGGDILISQLRAAEVAGHCTCGCRTISLWVPNEHPLYPYSIRVPVEMEVENPPVLFLLHVVGGYVAELEVIRGDLKSIDGPISVDSAKVVVNAPRSVTNPERA